MLKKRLLILAAGLMLLVIFVWFSNHGRVVIELSTADKNTISYKLTNQNGQKTNEVKTDSTKITRLVSKGSYEILISQNGKSSFSVIKPRGFFRKTVVHAQLEPEKSRQFVGNNPSPCMYYDGILYSYECKGRAVFNAHIPATDTLPTYVKQKNVGLSGSFEGLIKTGFGTVVLELAAADEDSRPPHSALLLSKGLSPSGYTTLKDLNPQKKYSISPYAPGFVAYDSDFGAILYYSSVDSKPQISQLPKATGKNLRALFFDVKGKTTLVSYSNNTFGEIASLEGTDNKNVKNEIFIMSDNSTKKFDFNDLQIAAAKLCGSQKLCLLANQQLRIYDISGKKAKLSFKVLNVHDIDTTDNTLLAVRDTDVLDINADNQNGSVSYSFGGYKYCGSQVDGSNYLLCLINNENNKIALRIDQGAINTDSIDKKINELQKMKEIDTVSIYGNHLSVVGNYGPLEFNSSLGGYSYDQEVQRIVNERINKEIDRLIIDRNKYSVSL